MSTKPPSPTVSKRIAGYLLGSAGLTVGVVLIVGVFFAALEIAGPALRSAQLAAVVSATLVDLTNQDRQDNQLQTLTVNPILVRAAQAKADDMARYSYFAHVSPSGINSWYWFKQAGYPFIYAGENLAVDFTDSSQVNQAWLNSPTHRANILNGHFTQIGIATAQGTFQGHSTIFVVQMFGTPAPGSSASASIQTAILPAIPTQMAFASTKSDESSSSAQVLGVVTNSASPATRPAPASPPIRPVVAKRLSPATSSVVSQPAQSFATTATQNVASIQAAPHYGPVWGFLVSSPEVLLRTSYFILGGILLLALLIRTEFEIRRHHLRHVVAVASLIVLMIVLFFIADHFIFVQPILGPAQQITGT
ncbi:hypothetical protein H0X32_00015 [Patescibacteria group bacterium]|nr:hypothetical protein [Patescibacteria group bacterium]